MSLAAAIAPLYRLRACAVSSVYKYYLFPVLPSTPAPRRRKWANPVLRHMKRLLFFSLLSSLFFLAAPLVHAQNDLEFEHDGLIREYNLYRPADLRPDAPLIFVLHGFSSSKEIAQDSLGFDALADRHGFAVCYPQGRRITLGPRHWNAGLTLSEVDDVGFLTDLAHHLQSEFNLNPDRTFACGFSNGGFMCYTLACEAPDVFRAIASVSGLMSGLTWETCDPARPVPVLQIHGLDDDFVPVDGSMAYPGGWGGAPRLDSIVSFWALLNNATLPELKLESAFAAATYFRNPLGGNEVWYFLISDLGHSWPTIDRTGIDAADVVWDFFDRYDPPSTSVLTSVDGPDLRVFPNPTASVVNIELNHPGLLEFRLTSLLGAPLLQGNLAADRTLLNLADLPHGVYFLHIGNTVRKILKTD